MIVLALVGLAGTVVVTPAGAAAPPPPASISGKVIGSDGKVPTGSVSVVDAVSRDWIDDINLSTTGAFTVTDLPAGSYKLYLYAGTAYADGWFGGGTEASAKVYKVSAGQALTGVTYTAAKAASISGKVIGSDGKVPTGSVTVHDAVSGDWVTDTGLSPTGVFTASGLPAGSYKLSYGAYNYNGSGNDYLAGWFGGANEAAAKVYKVSAGQALTGANYTATKVATLSGKLTGIPPNKASDYDLYLTNTAGESIDWTSIGDDGSFSFDWLAAGSYKVFVESEDGSAPAQYLGGGAGKTFAVKTGARTAAGTFALAKGKTTSISGTIGASGLGSSAGELWFNARLYMKVGSTWVKTPVTSSTDGRGGAYSIPGLGAGAYTVGFEKSQSGYSKTKVYGEFYKNRSALANADTVTLSGKAASGINGTVRATPLSALAAGTPTISGAATVDSTLTAKPGTWTSGSALSYQWLRDGKAISGATKSTYKVVAADRGHKLSVTVTGSKAGFGTVSKTSAAVGVANLFAAAPTPSISGTPTVGSTLTAKPGTWSPAATLAYQWLRDGKAISGATASTYKIAIADRGHKLSVKVTGSKSGYLTTAKTSAVIGVANVFAAAPAPTVSGTPTVGSTLTAKPGTWSPAATLAYQWLRDGKAISGATRSTYVVSAADRGHKLSVTVTGSKAGYETVVKSSAAVTVANVFATAPVPAISGTPTVGSTLTANAGAWSPAATLAYQWLRDGTTISGAIASTYTVATADRGHKVSVRVTASKAGYLTTAKTSAAASIANVFAATPVPTVSGTPTVGSTLTVKPGTWSPAATLTYQWLRDGKAISGATASTYKIATADRGHKLSVKVTATKSGYLTTAKTSASISVVIVFAKAPAPALSGAAKAGSTLTVKPGTWSPAPKLTYQWLRDGKAISKAAKPTYRIATADRGHKLSVRVTASKSGYLTTAKTSAAVSVARVFAKAPVPKISGKVKSGATVKVSVGTWSPAPKLSYQWLRDGKAISKATKSSYKVSGADRRHKLSVRVTATKSGYETASRTSGATRVP
ncbi:MAG: hypothetical protein LKI24_09480 [Acidipropionibacterium sp.]|nr:hypothetical protein [Acidipropionibacterium sp.]